MNSLNAPATSVDETTMGGMLRWQAVYRPDGVAITCDNRCRTWSELNGVANQVANALRELVIGRQQRELVADGRAQSGRQLFAIGCRGV